MTHIDQLTAPPTSKKIILAIYGIKAQTHSWTICRMRDIKSFGSIKDIFITLLSSRLRYPCNLVGRKTVKSRGDR